MQHSYPLRTFLMFLCLATLPGALAGASSLPAPDGGREESWSTRSARDEIRPTFKDEGEGHLVLESDGRPGLAGCWTKKFPVEGGRWYHFSAWRRAVNVSNAQRSGPVRVTWLDRTGGKALLDQSETKTLRPGAIARSEPEYPDDGAPDAAGWAEITGDFRAPKATVAAEVELHLRWASDARVEWRDIQLLPITAPVDRILRLATVNYTPNRGSPAANREGYAPLIVEAAKRGADLIVLGETVTQIGTKLSYADVAESIPGPSTEYFGRLARENNLHVVVGIMERDGHLVYNTSVLLSAEGEMLGKYRKVALPRGEVEAGIQPGTEYPVFATKLGKIGMMICYDGFFPEVARRLANNGAEIIAWPVAGCNPLLAAARACENHVYIVSNSYSYTDPQWMPSAIYDHEGQIVGRPSAEDAVVVAEVNLTRHVHWPSLGDFKAEWPRLKPE